MTIASETIAGWAKDLSDIRDEIERERAEIREQLAGHRKNVEFLKKREEHLFGLISGREHEQLPLDMAAAGLSTVMRGEKPAEREARGGNPPVKKKRRKVAES